MVAMISPERQLEEELLDKLRGLKYEHRPDIRDRATLEDNFRRKFDALNHVKLTDAEFQRLLEEIITPDVFAAAHTLRNRNSFTRDDGTPYAAWNDLLIDGRKPTDEEIIREASNPKRWHESKATIDKAKWPTPLKWMRERRLVPHGYGARTTKATR
jgi:hypothetical protein